MTTEFQEGDSSYALVVHEPDKQKAMQLMDAEDMKQALADLNGAVIQKFVYVAQGATQLTWAGTKEAARAYKNIKFGARTEQNRDGSWIITSYAHNLADNVSVEYPMPYPAFDMADQKQCMNFRAAVSKSLRNALTAVLPIEYMSQMIETWMANKNGSRSGQAQRTITDTRGDYQRSHDDATAKAQATRTPVALVPDPVDIGALRTMVEQATLADSEAAARLPKPVNEMDEAELTKTLSWLNRRARALAGPA